MGGARGLLSSRDGAAGFAHARSEDDHRRGQPALEDEKVDKIGHNIKLVAIHVFARQSIALHGVSFDTMLTGWLLDPGASRYSLEELSYHQLGVRKAEAAALLGKGKTQTTMDLVPSLMSERFACQNRRLYVADRAEAFEGHPLLEQARRSTRLVRDIEIPLIAVLADMESTGIKVDCDLLRNMSKTLEHSLATQESDIYELAGEKFNINSPTQLGAVLFEKLGLESKVKTATGKSSTSEEVLEGLASEHELPRKILDYRAMYKLKNTYVDALPGMVCAKTGRIHATFVQTGAETGRLASHDPNLQNIPIRSELGRSIRAAFKPGFDGWKIVVADYSQIELRILAHYCQDPALLDAFARGIDIHTAVAAQDSSTCAEKGRDARSAREGKSGQFRHPVRTDRVRLEIGARRFRRAKRARSSPRISSSTRACAAASIRSSRKRKNRALSRP